MEKWAENVSVGVCVSGKQRWCTASGIVGGTQQVNGGGVWWWEQPNCLLGIRPELQWRGASQAVHHHYSPAVHPMPQQRQKPCTTTVCLPAPPRAGILPVEQPVP